MSNHFHLVVSMLPAEANAWSDYQVAERWCRLFPKKKHEEHQAKIDAIAANAARVAVYRQRLQGTAWDTRPCQICLTSRHHKHWQSNHSPQTKLPG